MKWLKEFCQAYRPRMWVMNYDYSETWDKKLNDLLDNYNFTEISKHTTMLGNVQVWIGNIPYAAFHPWPSDKQELIVVDGVQKFTSPYSTNYRASRRTIIRAWEKLKKDSQNISNLARYEMD